MLTRRRKAKYYDWKHKPCNSCGSRGHFSSFCPRKARRNSLRKEAIATKAKRTTTSTRWFNNNPPDKNGFYHCYLQISPYCLHRLTNKQTLMEHVYPKLKYPALRYEPLNLLPSCEMCNKLKGSNTIAALHRSGMFPILDTMVRTVEWQNLEDLLEFRAAQLGLRLDRPEVG